MKRPHAPSPLIAFAPQATACGEVLRAEATIAGLAFWFEMDLARTWLHVIAADGKHEEFTIDGDGDVVATGADWVTEKWTDADFSALTIAVHAAKGGAS